MSSSQKANAARWLVPEVPDDGAVHLVERDEMPHDSITLSDGTEVTKDFLEDLVAEAREMPLPLSLIHI